MNKTKEKIFAYVAGPYSGDKKTIRENIQEAMKAAAYLRSKGYTVFCPHTNFMYLEGADYTIEGREAILDDCISWMLKCDIIFFMPGWKKSPGSVEEHRICKIKNKHRKYLTKQELIDYNNTI